MCGICGVYSPSGVDRSKVVAMNTVQAHRGPDGSGVFVSKDKKVALGHRRLAILDLSPTGRQPMRSADGSLVITFNGEIYNYKEFVPTLKKLGYKFKGTSDTEAILYAYQEYGEKCLDLFRGMFAFAIWDEKKKRLFIARDRLGEKPLYYANVGNSFYFASGLAAILEASGIKREVDERALHMYLLYNFHHVPEPFSIIKGVSKLPPAHYMIVDSSGVRIKRYWSFSYKKERKSERAWIDEFRALAKECVNLREVSDVPVSAFLSGGVDSSAIVALMKNRNLSTFSIGFNRDDPELVRARRISKLFKTKNKEIIFDSESIERLPELIYRYGEPYNLMPALYSFVLSEEIVKDFKVALAGNGADELFYGYDGSNGLLAMSKLEKVLPRSLARLLFHLVPKRFLSVKLGLLALSSPASRQKGSIYRYLGKRLLPIYSESARSALSLFDAGELLDKVTAQCDSPDLIERFYHAGLFIENAHSVTIIADATGMAHGLETRAPFLDHKLVEFAARLPVRYKVRSVFDKLGNKYLMRKSLEGILPSDILYGKKMGFGYNIKWGELLQTKYLPFVERAFSVELPETGLFDGPYLQKVLARLKRGDDVFSLVFGLICFHIWHDMFVKGKSFKDISLGAF
ncbi:asparagine synthase (glutamine-hydrolyzing) [Candidatus Woesearchaeota archaeon]|nr:asparagine synthase (glutamine-hydrolyzing) [Candidatus Woesearchaeota archaeon]